MNLIFMPMFVVGLMGVNRRLYDAGASYALAQPTLMWQTYMTYAAILLGVFQLPFIWNLWKGCLGSGHGNHILGLSGTGLRYNPWGGNTLEWVRDLSPIIPKCDFRDLTPRADTALIRPDTGTSASALGLGLFLASATMFFGSLFSAYVMLRAGSLEWPGPLAQFPWLETALLLGASASFSEARIRLISAQSLGIAFVAIRLLNDAILIRRGLVPSASLQLACWYTLGAVHTAFVFGAAVFSGWLAGPSFAMKAAQRERWLARIEATRRYWIFVALVWLALVGGFFI